LRFVGKGCADPTPNTGIALASRRGVLLHDESHRKALRYVLGSVLAFGALNAFGGGVYGLTGARAIPREWLRDSGFSDYFIPSLILIVVVGGALAAAAVALFAGTRRAPLLAMAAGEVVLLWMAFQLSIIGFRSWMQPVTIAVAVMAIGLTALLGSPTEERRMHPRRG